MTRVHAGRAALTAVLLLAAATACRRAGVEDGRVRLAYFPNLTHAQALVGDADGTFAREVGAPVVARQFNAGPAAMEALLGGDVDVAYVGPGPAAIAYLRSRGAAIRVIAGAVSGGAQLVARTAQRPADLAGRRVASPQLGNTQDISLRTWLPSVGLREGDGPREVRVFPLANSDILGLMSRGELDAAWVPEPWGARLRAKGAHVLVDERDLWEGGQFPATVLVATTRALTTRRAAVVAVLRAHLALTHRWAADPKDFGRRANARFGELTGRPLDDAVLQDAFSHLEPTADPLRTPLLQIARHAQALGYAPEGDLSGLVDGSLLEEARRTASLTPSP